MPRRMVRVVPLIISVTVSLVVLPVAINVATGGSLPIFLAPFAVWAWPAVGVLWLVATVLAVREFRRDDEAGARVPEHPRNRENALDRVDRVVAQRLRNSLAEKVRIALELDERPDAVIRRSNLRVHAVDGGPVPLTSSPLEAFRLLDESMLVLGAPGAGKTTMLLELTHSLVAEARTGRGQTPGRKTSGDSPTGCCPRSTGSTAFRKSVENLAVRWPARRAVRRAGRGQEHRPRRVRH